jgi:hypothetical protein
MNISPRARERLLQVSVLLFFLLLITTMVALTSGCDPKKKVIIPLDNPVQVKPDLSTIDAAGHSIATSGQKVSTEARKIVPVAPESAKIITDEAVNILAKAAVIDVTAAQALLKDIDNAKINQQKDDTIKDQQAEILALQADIVRLNNNVFTWIIRAAFGLGLLAFALAGGVFFYAKDVKAAATLAVGGICAILAAITANKMMAWDGPITGAVLVGIGAIFFYGVWLVLFNMKRKTTQLVETANAFASLPANATKDLKEVARHIQDPDTKELVDSVKKSLDLTSLSALK